MNNPYRKTLGKLIFLSSLILVSFFTVKSTSAAVRCETQYGGTQVCVTTGQLQVNKAVFDPQNNTFVDNLGINDHKFAPGEQVRFKISVKNVGDAAFGNVSVTDTPQSGFFDLTSGNLSFNLTNLNPGETRDTEIDFKVSDTSLLPQNNVICVINTAEAKADNNSDRDTSQLCMERKVLGVQTTVLPKTGPEAGLLTLFASITGLVSGVGLIRFGRREEKTDFQIAQKMVNKKGRGC